MPWGETSVMELRAQFIFDLQSGEYGMSELCRQYGISRTIGYKWLTRYHDGGLAALADHSRAPVHHPQAISQEVKAAIEAVKARHCRWGARKIRRILQQEHPAWNRYPAVSTIGAYLKEHGLTCPRRRRATATPTEPPLTNGQRPNEVWCIDFKGHFRTRDGRRCNPLTFSDYASRYLLCCQHLDQMTYLLVKMQCERVFREYGLPDVIRSDNGAPFAGRGLCGLSRLSYWWIRLGIHPERIAPGQPQQNGRHERMHRTLKAATARPPARSVKAQQHAFDAFRAEYNHERPHEALALRTPAECYCDSPRALPSRLPAISYPDHMQVRKVFARGELYYLGTRIFITECLAYEHVGLEQMDEDMSALYYCSYLLGYIDHRKCTVRPVKQRCLADQRAGQLNTTT